MTEHPITPSPELVEQWDSECESDVDAAMYLATQAARWGADQELEACYEWVVRDWTDIQSADMLLAARRPKPPSLKERALQAWAAVEAGTDDQTAMAVIRRALEEALDD